MSFQKLSPDARRMRTIIVALPLAGVTSYMLYKRLVLGEEQRRIPQQGPLLGVKTTSPAKGRGPSAASSTNTSPETDGGTDDKPEREKKP